MWEYVSGHPSASKAASLPGLTCTCGSAYPESLWSLWSACSTWLGEPEEAALVEQERANQRKQHVRMASMLSIV